MGLFSGAKAYNTGNQVRDQAAQNRVMQGSAEAYSNYRIANAQARQQALQNMMSLYAGPNQALAGISGGRGANMSQIGNNPFDVTPGYFNIGRAGTKVDASPGGGGYVTPSLMTNTSGSAVGIGKQGNYGAGQVIPFSDTMMGGNTRVGTGSGSLPTDTGAASYRPPAQNPFSYNPGGRR